MNNYEIVIGLEVHVELNTKTKIFCGCENKFGGKPNTYCCPICTAMPGTLPVLNKKVVDYAIATGLATNCSITKYIKFDRKNYFYPDLPKAYQISQLYLPICQNGYLTIQTSKLEKKIGIHEIHMEEDAGKLIHSSDCTLIDYNRCGVPLLEIVSKPDMNSSEEVIAYLEKLKAILQYLNVSDCKMQEGSMRADINLSVKKVGDKQLGTRTEMKNMSSFKEITKAIQAESKRQIELLENGEKVVQQTRRWDESKNKSVELRSKENTQDYRYFPEPDLPAIEIDDTWIEQIKQSLPELPEQKKQRYMQQYSLSEYDIKIITGSKYLVDLFEKVTNITNNPKETANMIMGDLMRMLKETATQIEDINFSAENLAKLIILVQKGTINRTIAKDIFEQIFLNNIEPESYVRDNNLELVNNDDLIKNTIIEVINANPQAIEDYKNGKDRAFKFLVGQSMKQLKSKANPIIVNKLLNELLSSI